MKRAHLQSDVTEEHTGNVRRIMISHKLAISGENLPDGTISAQVVVPRRDLIGTHPIVLCCVPGGGSSRRYFDLEVEEDPSYSFAEFAAAQGLITIAVDNLGTGDSYPHNNSMLTPHQVAHANSSAFRDIAHRIRTGTLSPGVPPLPNVSTVGVGHSMGGMLTVLGQSSEPLHSAIATLGFSLEGLPDQLTDEEKELISSPNRWNNVLRDLAEKRFSASLEPRSSTPRFPFYLESTPEYARRALTYARTNILPLPGLLSMIPGNITESAESISAPVFLGGGDHEPWHKPAALISAFPNSGDITFYVLEGAAHNHNVAEGRLRLWKRLCQWAIDVSGDGATVPVTTEPVR